MKASRALALVLVPAAVFALTFWLTLSAPPAPDPRPTVTVTPTITITPTTTVTPTVWVTVTPTAQATR